MRQPILTNRLILRDVSDADAEFLLQLDSDPEVLRYSGPQPSFDLGWYRDRIGQLYVPWQIHPWHGIRIVLDRSSNEFLGWVFVRPATEHRYAEQIGWVQPSETELGYRYHQSAWGRGIATEAARPLVQLALSDPGTNSVVASAMASNTASLRVLEKLGFERVGVLEIEDVDGTVVKMVCGGKQLCSVEK